MALPLRYRLRAGKKNRDAALRSVRGSAPHLNIHGAVSAGVPRFAVSIPIRVLQQASKRNALKRRVTETLRRLLPQVNKGLNAVITIHNATALDATIIRQELLYLLEKSGTLER